MIQCGVSAELSGLKRLGRLDKRGLRPRRVRIRLDARTISAVQRVTRRC